ncbi:endonuclease domain-containing protein [Corallococcus exercitus]|uniref:endonuclease domain-containing protein n=1 Tax=Corallococcus exercitus TaxID=2316736 RepID=UPI0035D42FF6
MAGEVALLDALDRQARRRAEGIATLSVLEGPEALGGTLWNRWAARHGQTVVEVSGEDPHAAALGWARALAATRDLGADAEALAMFSLTAANPRHTPVFRGKTAHERRVLLDALPPPALLPEATWALCRELVIHREAVEPGALPDAVRTALQKNLATGLRALHALVPPGKAPVVRVPAGEAPSCRGLRVAEVLSNAVPALAVACGVSSEALGAFLAGGETRLKALVREGVLEVPVEPSEAASAVATLRKLERTGATEAQRVSAAEVALAVLTGAGEAGADRARSKAEAYLRDRLEEHPGTAGLFELNARLHPEDKRSWEVDLLCRSLRIAVEIDGYHHFQDPERFRRDRRKDLDLQREGYWVYRLLATDVLSQLEHILHTLDTLIEARRREPGGREPRHGHRHP